MPKNIPFNKPFLTGKEIENIRQAISLNSIAGDGIFTKKCHSFFEKRYKFNRVFLTTSCTDALEMCGMLLNIVPGDEIIIPSFTFVSTANAFAMRGAKLVFADSSASHPNIDEESIEKLITNKTKLIVVVHYAGIACNMDSIMSLADKYKIKIVEDAAHGIDSYYLKSPLGSIGHLSAFSFHETKNIQCGEGGMLVMNDPEFTERAEIVRDKGTNRAAFIRGEIDKYGWVDIGSSFAPSDILAAFLFAQLTKLQSIQKRRIDIWNKYYDGLLPLSVKGYLEIPKLPKYSSNNAHLFYIINRTNSERINLINYLRDRGVQAVFHYQSLHRSQYYSGMHDGRELCNSDRFSDCLLRLPLYPGLSDDEISKIIDSVHSFFKNNERVAVSKK